MGIFVIRRLIQAIPTFFGITFFSFMLIILAPGDPVSLITFSPDSSPETAERLRKQLGLDRPPLIQYVSWLVGNDFIIEDRHEFFISMMPSSSLQLLPEENIPNSVDHVYGSRKGLLRGDLGNSIGHKRPVFHMILERVPATLQLSVASLIMGLALGLPLGAYAAVHQGGVVDQFARFISVIGVAIPQFWLGLILIVIFAVNWDLLPMFGMRDPTSTGFELADRLSRMIMPVTVLSLSGIATLSRYLRSSVLEALGEDYVRTASAKGLVHRRVIWGHAVRNGLLPVATILGPTLGALLSGSVIVEQVFSWPGMGRMIITAATQRDYPVVMGSVVIVSVLFIIGVLLSDILYAWLDPRVKYGESS
ncbi:MAG: ABC transporter permease [Anaerolineaceae bacterium]|nr:ABC transporter permease [Anaerolineaceae bacterium]MCY3935979.1 ABC transporter permease [Chloroflexota bacterium]MCY4008292.1 ABC transporter permease [Anaerolineaceae bacterium]MCY4105330.1 ABC transporter permease [Chloroflexota bacterium]